MAQFDLHRLAGGVLVVDLQTDLIGLDSTRIVAPLREAGVYTNFPGLTPIVDFDGKSRIVRLQELAAVPAAELGPRIGSIADLRDALKRGLDILIDGFLSRRRGDGSTSAVMPALGLGGRQDSFPPGKRA